MGLFSDDDDAYFVYKGMWEESKHNSALVDFMLELSKIHPETTYQILDGYLICLCGDTVNVSIKSLQVTVDIRSSALNVSKIFGGE